MAYFLNPAGLWDRFMGRYYAWRNPESDLRGSGYQSYQSLLAIGSGGLFGLGLGNSRQKHLHLPEPQNDFIFTVICEELGFIGAALVVGLFIAFVWRGFRIAKHAPDRCSSLIVYGLVFKVALQTILNLAVVTNSMPNTGIALPFFSYGGTAVMILLAQMGIVLNVSRYSTKNLS